MARLVAVRERGTPREAAAPDWRRWLAPLRGRAPGRRETERMLDLLADLLESGIALLDALGVLAATAPDPPTRRAAEAIARRLELGATLAEAMEAEGFRALVTSGVRAGEQGGTLPRVLRELAAGLRREIDTIARIRGAFAYPLTVLGLLLFVAALFSLWVLPRLSALLPPERQSIVTRAVAGVAGASVVWGPALLASLGGLAVAWRAVRQDDLQFRIPLIGPTLQAAAAARLWGQLGILLGAGVHLAQALDVLAEATPNPAVKAMIGRVGERLRHGLSFAEALDGEALGTEVARQLIGVGEQTGRLERQCERLSRLALGTLERAMRRVTSLVGPALLGVVAVAILLFFFGIMLPIYQSLGTVQPLQGP